MVMQVMTRNISEDGMSEGLEARLVFTHCSNVDERVASVDYKNVSAETSPLSAESPI